MDYLEVQSFNEDMKQVKDGIENFKSELEEIRHLTVSTGLQIVNVQLLSDTMKSWLKEVVKDYAKAVAKKRKPEEPLIKKSADIY